jgi:hypothetical protein
MLTQRAVYNEEHERCGSVARKGNGSCTAIGAWAAPRCRRNAPFILIGPGIDPTRLPQRHCRRRVSSTIHLPPALCDAPIVIAVTYNRIRRKLLSDACAYPDSRLREIKV